MPDRALCDGVLADDGRPRAVCRDCARYTTPRGVYLRAFVEPLARRVSGTSRWQCEMRIEGELSPQAAPVQAYPGAISSSPQLLRHQPARAAGGASSSANKSKNKGQHVTDSDGA